MPRRNKNAGKFDFAIHEDPPPPSALMDEGSDIHDFADKLSESDGRENHYNAGDDIPIHATDSSLTKASTLVNGKDDDHKVEEPSSMPEKKVSDAAELTIDSMLEELEDGKKLDNDDDQHSEASVSRRESIRSETTHEPATEHSFSRRASTMTDGTYDQETDASASRRESALTNGTYDDTTEDSASRRESAMTGDTYESGRRGSGQTEHGDESALEPETEGSVNEASFVDDNTDASESRRESAVSSSSTGHDRRASARTEALIHAAAREIVDQINHGQDPSALLGQTVAEEEEGQSQATLSKQSSARPSEAHESVIDEAEPGLEEEETQAAVSKHSSARPSEVHESLADEGAGEVGEEINEASHSHQSSARPSGAHESMIEESEGVYEDEDAIRESIEVDEDDDDHHIPSAGEGGDSSSHNGNDDDVFSDHSPRSSVGSASEIEHRKMSENITQRSRTPRVSDFSHYETDQEDMFVPTVRGTPRPPFRSPSSVKAMQMSSPPPSVLGSSRSSRRTPLPTVSRLGSPSASAQYSPKNMKTPPRFKRNTPPLVLLHATLLPLRWPWGDVLDNCHADELTEGGHAVRDAWRLLQDRLGDTVCERGILLPHPQNDFEVLEERLLEALELPLRRRARILECGHYLGPSNEMTLLEEEDEYEYDYEDSRASRGSLANKTHWCGTCCSEIKFESLGADKVFRVKVYASNGLIRAGAWEACWKEMERVDVEFEPIVESDVHEELVRLDAEQQRALELQQEDEHDLHDDVLEEPEQSYLEDEPTEIHHMPSTPAPEPRAPSMAATPAPEDERWMRDEQRLREIYGHTPPSHAESARASHGHEPTPEPSSADYRAQTQPSPPQHNERRGTNKDASLPELIMEALRVMMQDKKNVMIALMSVLVLVLALRGGSASGPHNPATFQTVVKGNEAPTVTVTERDAPLQETMKALSSSVEAAVPSESLLNEALTPSVDEEVASSQATDPCSSVSGSVVQAARDEVETVVSERIVRVVETITETAIETATVTEKHVDEPRATDEAVEDVPNVEEPVESVTAGDAGESIDFGVADEVDGSAEAEEQGDQELQEEIQREEDEL